MPLTWNEYRIQARKTAIYPVAIKIAYPMLGLVGEAFEYVHCNSDLNAEAGDILWYTANLEMDLGIESPDNLIENISKDYDLLRYVGRMAELVKKFLRDGSIKGEQWNELCDKLHEIRSVLLRVHENVLENNLTKLFSRQQRGVLGGSGDNR